jgi:glycosyltransferase involved in cell wall biosynthesis/SAM-dependent methyltransferase
VKLRVAFFSPMPPALSGIADYSEALVEHLSPLAGLTVFHGTGHRFDPAAHDIALYQIGNNPDHAEAYETALRHPGVVVLHEANLHHLIAALTIKRGDWDAYMREVEYDGGAQALAFARRARSLEVGPDYDGVPMLRRLLANSRGLIAHSDYVIARARQAGYTGPAAKIPHGAWITDVDRMTWRARLGVSPAAPLIGIFGHLKPYKRIAESLRAFRRVVRRAPHARLILAGEPHPDLDVERMTVSLGIAAEARVLGRVDIGEFVGYLAASDIVLNLRYPTVGETSGTLLRAMGLGKAVIVSDVGAFSEFPSETCLKLPIGAAEEDLLAEYLTLLVERRDLAAQLGQSARTWVEQECRWDRAASLYASFLESVHRGTQWSAPPAAAPAAPVPIESGYLHTWADDSRDARAYLDTHIDRLEKTLSLVPPGGPDDAILEMGAYMQITPALKTRLGYGHVRGCYYGPAGRTDHREKRSANGEEFACEIDLFDAGKDRFPYEDTSFDTVLCCELIEHLPSDPMFLMVEVNRILKDGGAFILTTPNIASLRALAAALQGFHPGFFPAYLRPEVNDDARHAREYTPKEIYRLFHDAGFTVEKLETGPFRNVPTPELIWVEDLLGRYHLPTDLRGDGIYILGRKTGPVRDRWPAWLYN